MLYFVSIHSISEQNQIGKKTVQKGFSYYEKRKKSFKRNFY